MTNEQRLTSLNLSQKLQEAGFEGESEYVWAVYGDSIHQVEAAAGNKKVFVLKRRDELECPDCEFDYEPKFNSYDILNDLCVRYKNEMFDKAESVGAWDFNSRSFTQEILHLLQQGMKQEAEQYILDHAIIFKNK